MTHASGENKVDEQGTFESDLSLVYGLVKRVTIVWNKQFPEGRVRNFWIPSSSNLANLLSKTPKDLIERVTSKRYQMANLLENIKASNTFLTVEIGKLKYKMKSTGRTVLSNCWRSPSNESSPHRLKTKRTWHPVLIKSLLHEGKKLCWKKSQRFKEKFSTTDLNKQRLDCVLGEEPGVYD